MLSISASLATALAGENIRYAWLVAFPDMPTKSGGGTGVYFTDHGENITLAGDTYESLGDMLRLSPVVREKAIKLQSYTLTLAGADTSVGVSNARWLGAQNITGQPCMVSLALLDAAGAVISGEAIALYEGTVHLVRESESGASSIVDVTLTSPWSKPGRTSGRITSDYNQKDRYPGDDFFKFAHRERTNIGWGGEEDD